MGYRTYEADRHGRITIYPSLDSSAGKSGGMLKSLIKKLLEIVGQIGKSSAGRPLT